MTKEKNQEEILKKILNILNSVARDNFSLLPKTRNLEKTLTYLIESLYGKSPFENKVSEKEKLLKNLQGFEKLPLEEKKKKILFLVKFFSSLSKTFLEREESPKKVISENFSEKRDLPSEAKEEFKEIETSQNFQEIPKIELEEFKTRKESLKFSIEVLSGVGPKIKKKFEKRGIHTLEDLLFFFPKDYEDRREFTPVYKARENQRVVLRGEILKSGIVQFGKRKVFEALFSDGTGFITLKWFNFKEKLWKGLFAPGKKFFVIGEVSRFGKTLEIIHPEMIEDKGEIPEEIGKILPVYPSIEGLSEKALRKIIKEAVHRFSQNLNSFIPQRFLKKRRYFPLSEAVKIIHFPENLTKEELVEFKNQKSVYHKSVAYDEFFFLELALGMKKLSQGKEKGIAFNTESELVENFLRKLPFELTRAQKRVIEEIKKDMASPTPMNRLLQGDVGSGKTVVAFVAALIAIDNGYQVALMAPTEILASQHYQNFRKYATLMGINFCLLTGSTSQARKREIYHGLKTGFIKFVIGTHALFQEKVEFKKLGLVIIDEQHRFGVLQRGALREKGKEAIPDTLVMTATPIPRTLALTIYGDLEVSIIDEMPKGRKPLITRLFFEKNKHKAYEKVREELKKGHQAYVVLPLIEDSEKLNLHSVISYGEYLQKEVFPEFKVGILHGKINPFEKEKIMKEFKEGKIHVLVSTTVIEVGVDVPNATVIVIEHAERFGLSQLHQLRGRVGRSEFQSYCFLIAYTSPSSDTFKRLIVLTQTNDGFKIAEEDLKLRGPGEFLGTKQSGYLEFRKADLVRDYQILMQAREDAFELLKTDPELKNHPWLKLELLKRWEERLKLSDIA